MADGVVVVVGAGPAGLAVAAELARHGVPHVVLERGDGVGAAWRQRYDSLRLHTWRRLSGLPGAPIPRRYGMWVARDDLVAYLEDYAARSGVTPRFGTTVTRIDRVDGGWRVAASGGDLAARAVVLATGYSTEPHLPDWPGRDAHPGEVIHSSAYRRPQPYAGRSVLVVGAGNSAAEIATELVGVADRVELAVRTPPNIVRRATFGVPSQVLGVVLRPVPEALMNPLTAVLRRVSVPDLGAVGLPAPGRHGFTQFLRTQTVPILDHGFVAAVRSGRIVVRPAVEGFAGGAVLLAGGEVARPDAVIAATGYRTGLEPIVGHLDVLDGDGVPRAHGAAALPHAPGLHFAGIDVVLAGLLREIGRDARALGRALARA